MLTIDRSILYTCVAEENYAVTKFEMNIENKRWEAIQEISRAQSDTLEMVLQFKLNKTDDLLLGKSISFLGKSYRLII